MDQEQGFHLLGTEELKIIKDIVEKFQYSIKP